MAKRNSPKPFSPERRLEPLEIAFIEAVEAGRNFEPSADELDSDAFIRGGLIRAILLGVPLKHHPANKLFSKARRVEVTAHGLCIVPAQPTGKAARAAAAAGDRHGPLLRIAGSVNLRGVAAAGGLFLPPLELSRCTFDQPIELSGAHLQSLTLRGCRFSRLRAQGAKVNAGVILDQCRPRNPPTNERERHFATHELAAYRDGRCEFVASKAAQPERAAGPECDCPLCTSSKPVDRGTCRFCCVIDFSFAEIAGGLGISNSYLRAPKLIGRKYRTPKNRDECAAELRGIQVRDSIGITRSTVLGRVSFVSAEVGDDIWILGGKFIASAERRTFDFQLAKIGGLLAFQADRPTEEEEAREVRALPVMVIGQIAGIGLSASEIWVGEGYYYGQDAQRRGAYATLNFAKANLRLSFKIGAYHEYHVLDPERPTGTARIHGEICLAAADIGKNLELHGVEYDKIEEVLQLKDAFFDHFGVDREEKPYLKLRAHGLKVDRRLYISHGRFRDAESRASDVARLCRKTVQPAAIDLWKSTIGTGLRIGEHSSCTGAVRINSCVIGREAIIGCRTIEPAPAECSRDGVDPRQIPYVLDIAESTIKGHLKIGRRVPRPHTSADPSSASAGQAVTLVGGISLESADVQGSILLGHVTFDLRMFELDGERTGDGLEGVEEDRRVALNLRDCVCGSDLDVHSLGWRLPPLTQVERCRLDDPPRRFDPILPWRQARRFRPITQSSFAVIDLRGLQCGLLIDGFGAEWGLIYRLRIRLAGTRIGEVEPASHKAPHSYNKRPEQPRLRWLAFQNCKQRIVDETETPNEGKWEAPGFWERHYCSQDDDFVPQAYDALSCVYRKAGEDWTSEEILVEKKNIQNTLRFRQLFDKWKSEYWTITASTLLMLLMAALWFASVQTGFISDNEAEWFRSAMVILIVSFVLIFWPFFVALFQLTFRLGFRYGLSANFALLVFLICIVLGSTGVHWARNGGLQAVTNWTEQAPGGILRHEIALVLDVEYEPVPDDGKPESGQVPSADLRAAGTRGRGRAVYAQASPCNLNVSSPLYAVDVFIPLIDLDQERRCTVRDALPGADHDRYFWWRFAKAMYELLGWVVTSLVILTFTGVLRRDLER